MNQAKTGRLDRILTIALVLCALATVATLVRREFFPPPTASGRIPPKPTFIKDWRTYLPTGILSGSSAAPVQLMEFADFECPFCANAHKDLKALRERYPTQVAVTYVHFPLPMHRFAPFAARASECAVAQGQFEAMRDVLFARQQEFGLTPWTELASKAGITETAAFDSCMQSNEPVPRIEAGKQLARQLDVNGTPTIVINGWKRGHPPTAEELTEIVDTILAGKDLAAVVRSL